MPRSILLPAEVARIARRNGFTADSFAVLVCHDQAEYLHGLPSHADERNPERPWAVDARTGRLDAALLLDGLLRDMNLKSAETGENTCPASRLH